MFTLTFTPELRRARGGRWREGNLCENSLENARSDCFAGNQIPIPRYEEYWNTRIYSYYYLVLGDLYAFTQTKHVCVCVCALKKSSEYWSNTIRHCQTDRRGVFVRKEKNAFKFYVNSRCRQRRWELGANRFFCRTCITFEKRSVTRTNRKYFVWISIFSILYLFIYYIIFSIFLCFLYFVSIALLTS